MKQLLHTYNSRENIKAYWRKNYSKNMFFSNIYFWQPAKLYYWIFMFLGSKHLEKKIRLRRWQWLGNRTFYDSRLRGYHGCRLRSIGDKTIIVDENETPVSSVGFYFFNIQTWIPVPDLPKWGPNHLLHWWHVSVKTQNISSMTLQLKLIMLHKIKHNSLLTYFSHFKAFNERKILSIKNSFSS